MSISSLVLISIGITFLWIILNTSCSCTTSSFYAEAQQGIGTFYVNGTIISMQGSSDTEDDSIPNATSASIGDGNWSLVVENGIVKKFNASLVGN